MIADFQEKKKQNRLCQVKKLKRNDNKKWKTFYPITFLAGTQQ